MYWADKLAEEIPQGRKHRVDDMKTPSGHAHAGSLRAIATHGLVFEAMQQAGHDVDFTYVVNDMDPMDGLPVYLSEEQYRQHMGKPLFMIDAPDGKSESYAKQYASEYIEAFNRLHFKPKIHWSSELYKSGKIDPFIRMSLDNAEVIRKIYKKVAGQHKPKQWHPFQVICPECGKIGTNLVTDWDGNTVEYECKRGLVEWATGCGEKGRISPFGGTGKLMWKVDWAAHWAAMDITVEGAGKDHFSEGGSRYVSAAIIKEVFNIEPPFGFLHEFLLIGGAKMSSSKGNATTAAEFSQIIPPELGRFLFVRTPYQRAINFDPSVSNTIPDLFDEYDRNALAYFESGTETDFGRYFVAAHVNKPPDEAIFLPRFRQVATLLQMPSVDLKEYFTKEKGSPLNTIELAILEERIQYAQIWLDKFADESEIFEVKSQIPSETKKLTGGQREFLSELVDLLKRKSFKDGEALQQAIYKIAKASKAHSKGGFEAIYLSLLGKTHGPKAGWLLFEQLKTEKMTLLERLADIAEGKLAEVESRDLLPVITISDRLKVSDEVRSKWPSITIGYAEIEGVQIASKNKELEKLKAERLSGLKAITRGQINSFPEIMSYRKLYKETGVDWHSRRPSPEALLRRLTQGKDLYSINTCVDAYNLIVMENRVSVGAFNYDTLQFPTELRIARGDEEIMLLGDTDSTKLKEGELCYFDMKGPYNLDFNFRDAERTKVTLDTTNLLINVEGVYDISRAQVEETLIATVEIIKKFCGGTVKKLEIIR